MTPLIILAALGSAALVALWPRRAYAHCDTWDGPAVAAGQRALASANLDHAVFWVPAGAEAELREVFDSALRVRAAGGEAAALADRLFLETLVRLHRAGEGAGFDGLKPAGTTDPVVVAADRAIATGTIAPLAGLLPDDRLGDLETTLHTALSVKDHPVADVDAGRRYLAAYVAFVKSAESAGHGDGPARGDDPSHRCGCGHDAHSHC